MASANQTNIASSSRFGLWWRHQAFSALLALCEGNPAVTRGFPSQRPVTWSCDVFFHIFLNKRLSKQSRRRCFETPSHSLWRHCNGCTKITEVTLRDLTKTLCMMFCVGVNYRWTLKMRYCSQPLIWQYAHGFVVLCFIVVRIWIPKGFMCSIYPISQCYFIGSRVSLSKVPFT